MARTRRRPGPTLARALAARLPRAGEAKGGPFIMVIFGGTGDLTSRKLIPALFALFLDDDVVDGISDGRNHHHAVGIRREPEDNLQQILRLGCIQHYVDRVVCV